MKKLNVAEMRTVEGGATYSKKCDYCGKKFSAKYYEIIGWIAAQVTVLAAIAKHKSAHRMTGI